MLKEGNDWKEIEKNILKIRHEDFKTFMCCVYTAYG